MSWVLFSFINFLLLFVCYLNWSLFLTLLFRKIIHFATFATFNLQNSKITTKIFLTRFLIKIRYLQEDNFCRKIKLKRMAQQQIIRRKKMFDLKNEWEKKSSKDFKVFNLNEEKKNCRFSLKWGWKIQKFVNINVSWLSWAFTNFNVIDLSIEGWQKFPFFPIFIGKEVLWVVVANTNTHTFYSSPKRTFFLPTFSFLPFIYFIFSL